ncbi:MAG: outer membrane adhesin-like protein [Candidatus Gottesmanbacteria bacterium GW2011_GWA2_43_14]|uniref:Outer membrane adhesin-like protein n=1 Tax=Candidatus Gottesmanbacteria bacterium GW2011_GWA2_43_14 TaxID=1618443 RepID=A0A0G1DJ52_9BACT|nr:MAG: outer membrane adhesin-like protein [Candidatus Gottesmanbacteria bacterium GW2011_GWA2_43_14]
MKNYAGLIICSFFLIISMISVKPVKAESTAGVLPHATDFLSLPACGSNCGTTYFPTASASQRSAYISQLKSRGYTHAYLSVTASAFNYYPNPSGFNSLLTELNTAGIKAVVWLTSDTGTWKGKTVAAIKTDLSAFIPQIDAKTNSYVVGLESNEYWTASEIQEIGNHMDSLTNKPLAAHQTPNKWEYCSQSWCDYMVLQTNPPTESTTGPQVATKVNNARTSLGKPVVVGEYHRPDESVSISLANYALDNACAAGFGNGGTPSKIEWPAGNSCGNTGPTPTAEPTGVNHPPTVQNSTYSTAVETPLSIIFSFADPDGPGPYIYSVTQLPLHGSINGAATDNDWVYTPVSGYSGNDTFKWRVNDGLAFSNTATVTINVGTIGKQGDANGDTKVDGLDYVIWLNHYNQQVAGAGSGDFNNSGKVDGLDYVIWLNNYNI